jgi:hypothetical protein
MESCVEGGLSRADSLSYDGPRTDIGLRLMNRYWLTSHERILAYVSQCGKRIRSQELRLLPASISAASPHNLLQRKSL